MSLAPSVSGPFRAIGVRYAGKNEHQEIKELWGQFLSRRAEIAMPERAAAFGVCRCIPATTDGSFEYIAAFEALPDAVVPYGVVALELPRAQYSIHRFETVQDYRQIWQQVSETVAADPEWTAYCSGPGDCQCNSHPGFEYYPPEFSGTGPVSIYIPVHPAKH